MQQHGNKEAFGAPGIEPRWTHGNKNGVGTAYAASSRIWFTLFGGIVTEVYYPTVDRPQMRDLQYLVTDGKSFFHEEKRDLKTTVERISGHTLGFHCTNSDPDGRYSISKEVITDPHFPCVLQRTRLTGPDEKFLNTLKLFALCAPHLQVGGYGNTGYVKGGVGKSLVASILAQYFRHYGREIHCIDSDPVNQTFSQYAELGAEHLALMRDGRIDSGGFDILLHRLLIEEGTFIVDNGASTFVPLWGFIVESNALEMLSDAGRKLFVHTIITGGQALGDTLKGFKSLADSSVERNIVVWLNEYFGVIERDGKTFTDMQAYKDWFTLRRGTRTRSGVTLKRSSRERGPSRMPSATEPLRS